MWIVAVVAVVAVVDLCVSGRVTLSSITHVVRCVCGVSCIASHRIPLRITSHHKSHHITGKRRRKSDSRLCAGATTPHPHVGPTPPPANAPSTPLPVTSPPVPPSPPTTATPPPAAPPAPDASATLTTLTPCDASRDHRSGGTARATDATAPPQHPPHRYPLKRRRGRPRADVWRHFTHVGVGLQGRSNRFRCKRCGWECNSGATYLRRHWQRCSSTRGASSSRPSPVLATAAPAPAAAAATATAPGCT